MSGQNPRANGRVCVRHNVGTLPTVADVEEVRRIAETGEGVVWEEDGLDDDDPVEQEVIEHRKRAREESNG